MRIPVYRSQARATSEAPGARITARMNAQPFVQAALKKGETVTQAVNEVGEYASMRYKMLVETQKNEAIFAAKEALMSLSRDLEKSSDIGNIFDGKNKYNEGVNGVYNELRARVGKNKYALQDFENSFKQMEIPIKFRLKDVIDSKIIARRQAALKALEVQQIELLSNPNLSYNSDEVALSQAGVQIAHDQAARAGGINPEALGNVNDRILSKALKNVIPAYAGTDLDSAVQLAGVLDEINKVRAGGDPKDMKIGGDIPAHVINMLQAVPPEEAAAVIQDTIKMASTFYSAQGKLEEQIDKDIQEVNEKAYNAITSIEDNQQIPASIIKSLIPPSVFDSMDDQYKSLDNFYGYEAKDILSKSLQFQFWSSPAQNEIIEKELRGEGSYFAPEGQGDEAVYAELYAQAISGRLTTNELSSHKEKLTRGQYTQFLERIYSKSDQNLNSASKILANAFNYNAQQAAGKDDRLSRASKSGFQKADGALRTEFFRRSAEGNPMSASEVFSFAKQQENEFIEIYRQELRQEYLEDVATFENASRAFNLTIDREDPIGSVDNWYNSLSATEQEQQKERVAGFKARMRNTYAKEGLF